MKKKVFIILIGVTGLAFYLTLGLIVAPYIKNGGLLLMFLKPYKPFLQFEWCGGLSIRCMLFFAVAYAVKIDVKVSGGENLKYLTDEEVETFLK